MAYLGRTRYDYATEVNDGRSNAIIMAVIWWLCRTFPEAPVRLQRRRGDELTPEPTHEMLMLLETPNPHYSGILLWYATIADFLATGNAYWFKVRSGAGRPVQLWWLPSILVEPTWPEDGSEYLSGYTYRPDGKPQTLAVEDVVHFRYGLDPLNMRKGLSLLGSLAREIFTDDEAANFSATLLRNLGVPGVIISPESEMAASPDDLAATKTIFKETFGNDKRGEPMVMSGPTKVQVLSFNPQQMNLKDLRRLPEERVTAVFGIPAVVAGLGAGLDRSTFANFAEAREAAYESNVIPTQRLLAAELKTQLLVDFSDPRQYVVDFDLSGVRVLQDDQNALATRLQVLYDADLIRRSEARQMLGQMSGPEDEGYKSELAAASAPIPATLAPPRQLPPGDEPDEDEPEMASRSRRSVKAFTSDDAWYTRSSQDVRALTDAATPPLEMVFRRTGRQVVAALPATMPKATAGGSAEPSRTARKADDDLPPSVADLVAAEHEAELTRALGVTHEAAITRAVAAVNDGLGVSFQLPFAVRDEVMADLATRIRGIADTTRDDVRRIVRAGLDEGVSIDELARRLTGLFEETYQGRARTIARTESATAYNQGAALSYRESGIVRRVRVHDGDDCGWTRHDDTDRAHGSVRDLDAARAYPLAHPNCLRALAPIVGDDE
jgi:HK97 family phage portal protein